MVSNKLLLNLTITTHDTTNVNSMFGPNLADVRGNKVINKPGRLDMEEYVNISEYFYKLNKFVRLPDDVMFFNGNAL